MDKEQIQEMAEKGADYLEQHPHNINDNERFASLAGGAVATLWGLRRGGIGGLLIGAIGGALLYRGATGYCAVSERMGRNTARADDQGLQAIFGEGEVHVKTGITIDRKPEELYGYWRDFEKLPHFMRHIVDITRLDERRTHWVAQAPFGKTVEWDSEVTEDVPNERIAWRSLGSSPVRHEGEVRFRPAAGGRGTEVEVEMSYHPPGGKLGTTMAEYFNGITRESMHEDIRRFKQLMEAGEMPTSERTAGTPASPPTGGSMRH